MQSRGTRSATRAGTGNPQCKIRQESALSICADTTLQHSLLDIIVLHGRCDEPWHLLFVLSIFSIDSTHSSSIHLGLLMALWSSKYEVNDHL